MNEDGRRKRRRENSVNQRSKNATQFPESSFGARFRSTHPTGRLIRGVIEKQTTKGMLRSKR